MISHTPDLEPVSPSMTVLQFQAVLPAAIIDCQVIRARTDILKRVSIAIAQEFDPDLSCLVCIAWGKQLSPVSDPASIQRTRDLEGLAFLASRVVDDPSMFDIGMVIPRSVDGQPGETVVAWIGQGESVFLEHQVSPFGQVADTFLVSILKGQGIFGFLLAVWNGWPRTGIRCFALGRSHPVPVVISGRCLGVWYVGNAVVGLDCQQA